MKTFKLAKEDCRLLNNLLDVEMDFQAENRQQRAAKRLIKQELSKGEIPLKRKPFLINVLDFSIRRFEIVNGRITEGRALMRLYRRLRYGKLLKQMQSSKAVCEKLKAKIELH